MMNKNKLFANEIESSLYLGWRGFGSLLGARYYLNTENKVITLISISPLKGIELQSFLVSDVLCVELYSSSLFYAIIGALAMFLKTVTADAAGILIALIYSIIVGLIIERLYERPRIELLLEDGEKIKLFTNFSDNLPKIIQKIETAIGNHTSEGINSFHYYYTYQTRAPSKYIEKKKRSLTFIYIVAIIGIFASIVIPAYQDYMVRARWSKAIASTAYLKLGISECLNDYKGNVTACNDLSSSGNLVKKYGATSLSSKNSDFLSVSVMSNAGIRIEGSKTLERCILDIVPSVDITEGTIAWDSIMQTPGIGGSSIEKCRTYVKNAK